MRLDPHNPAPWVARGLAFFHKGELDQAMADYTQALHLDPQYADAYRARAALSDQLQDTTHAFADRARAEQLADK